MLKKVISFGSKFMDYKMGIYGAIVMGSIVFAINFNNPSGLFGAFTASLKQAAYTFLLGGIFIKGCEYLATRVKDFFLAIILAVVIPSAVTIFLTYNVHRLKGTPKPIQSTIPTLIIIPATAVWGYKKRKQYILENNLEEQN